MVEIWETSSRQGVHRLTTGRRVLGILPASSHCYRIGSTLIDAGSPRLAQRVLAEIGDEITHVLLTHAHEDHIGAAAELSNAGAEVFAPEPLLGTLQRPPELPYFRSWTWGEATPVEASPLGKAVETPDGVFEVVETPGHSPHHVALFEPDRGWLFTGDAFLGKRKEHRFAEELDPMLDSLDRLADLETERLYPGHGQVRDDPGKALAETIAYYEELIEQARNLRAEGHHVRGIRRKLLGWEGPLTLYTGGEFSKANLARQLVTSQRAPD